MSSTPDQNQLIQIITELLFVPKKVASEATIPVCNSVLCALGKGLKVLKSKPGKNKGDSSLDVSDGKDKEPSNDSKSRADAGVQAEQSRGKDVKDLESSKAIEDSQSYFEISMDGKPKFRISQAGFKNDLSFTQSQELAAALSVPPGVVLPDSMPVIEGNFYTQVDDGKWDRHRLLSVRPDQPVVNKLSDISASFDFPPDLLSDLKRGQTRVAGADMVPMVNQMFRSGLADNPSSYQLSRWAIGSLLSPKNWYEGLRQVVQNLTNSVYSLAQMSPLRKAQFRDFSANVEQLLVAFGDRDISVRQLDVPPSAFYREMPNAVWHCKTLQMGNSYCLNYTSSLDLPGKISISITDFNGKPVYSCLYDKQREIVHTRNFASTSYERSLVTALFEPTIARELRSYIQAIPWEFRDINSWYDNGRLMPSYLGPLAQAVHVSPWLTHFMPKRFNDAITSVYQTSFAATAEAMLKMSAGSRTPGVLRIPNPADPKSQYEINFSQLRNSSCFQIYEVPIDGKGKLNVQDKRLLFWGGCRPFIGSSIEYQDSKFRLSDFIALNDHLYSRFTNNVLAASSVDPHYVKSNATLINQGNFLAQLREGSVEFLESSQFPVTYEPLPRTKIQQEILEFQDAFKSSSSSFDAPTVPSPTKSPSSVFEKSEFDFSGSDSPAQVSSKSFGVPESSGDGLQNLGNADVLDPFPASPSDVSFLIPSQELSGATYDPVSKSMYEPDSVKVPENTVRDSLDIVNQILAYSGSNGSSSKLARSVSRSKLRPIVSQPEYGDS